MIITGKNTFFCVWEAAKDDAVAVSGFAFLVDVSHLAQVVSWTQNTLPGKLLCVWEPGLLLKVKFGPAQEFMAL